MNDPHWQRLQALFHEAAELDPVGLNDLLVRTEADSPALAEELRQLLHVANLDSGILITPVLRTAKAMMSDEKPAGHRIGAYRIVGQLGAGGMGIVYLAERADESFEQRVAIKLIAGNQHSESIARRFIAERQILASLKHPNIAHLLDGGSTERGEPYFAMEYVEGRNIIEYCDTNQLSLERRIRLFIEVCAAVSHAHRQLILHRDIKPSNILVTESGQPKLLDFGIAKLLGDEGASTSNTGVNQWVMTPEYASPEQVLGQPVGVASDVYQLGLLLYLLLSGHSAQAMEEKSIVALKEVIVDRQPMSPSSRNSITGRKHPKEIEVIARNRATQPQRLVRSLKGDIDTIVLKCLNKEPERRYHGVDALMRDLEAHLRHQPIHARGPSRGYRFNRFLRRHWAGASAATIALLALLGGLALSLVSLEETRSAERRAEIEAATAVQTSEFLIDALTDADPRTVGGETVTVLQVLERSAGSIDALAQQPEVQVRLLTAIGKAYTGLGEGAKAELQTQRAIAIAQTLVAEDSAVLIEPMAQLAASYELQGRYDEELAIAERMVALARQLSRLEPHLLRQLQSALLNHGEFDKARAASIEALDMLVDQDDRAAVQERINVLLRLGHIDHQLGDYDQSLKNFRRALDQLGHSPEDRALRQRVNQGLVGALTISRQFEEAESVSRESLVLARQVYGENHMEVLRVLLELGTLQTRSGKLDAAELTFADVLRVADVAVGKQHPDYVHVLQRYANLKRYQGRYQDSLDLLGQALKLATRELGPHNTTTINTQAYMLPSMIALARFAEAIELAKQVRNEFAKKFPPEHGHMLSAAIDLARAEMGSGRIADADQWAHQVVTDARSSQSEIYTVQAQEVLFDTALARGNLKTANERLRAIDQFLSKQDDRRLHPAESAYRQRMASYLEAAGRSREALSAAQDAVDLQSEKLGKFHPLLLRANMTLADALSRTGENEKAETMAMRSFDGWLARADQGPVQTAVMARSFAAVLMRAGKPSRAITLLKTHINALETSLGVDHYQALGARCLLGISMLSLGQAKKGKALQEASLRKLEIQLGPNSPLVAECAH